MPAVSKLNDLTPAQLDILDAEMMRRHFCGYTELTEWINKNIKAGISRSSVARRGAEAKQRIGRIRDATVLAEKIVNAGGGKKNQISRAIVELLQERLFELFMAGNMTAEDIKKIAPAISNITRASVIQQEHLNKERDRVIAAAQEGMKKGGVPKGTAKKILDSMMGK